MILFVDDERRYMTAYVEELEAAGYHVSIKTTIDAAHDYFEEHLPEIKLLILDIMMSPGKTFQDEDTHEGLRTGVNFYERVRDRAPDLPVIILTNADDEELIDRFDAEENCRYRQKEKYMPVEIAQEVKEILSSLK
jgi:DNA-binding response OmpR family regulator